jgi:hypothetical protein
MEFLSPQGKSLTNLTSLNLNLLIAKRHQDKAER